MSMQDYACSGYVIELQKLYPLFSQELIRECEDNIEELDQHQFVNSFPSSIPSFDIFVPYQECNLPDDMSYDKVYAVFDQTDLYELVPKDTVKHIADLVGEVPTQEHYTIWG